MFETTESGTVKQSGIHGAHILLVDDSLLYLDIAERFLMAAGATVSMARNGIEAMNLLAGNSFSCVLLDMHMPVMDGIETVRQIRATPALADMRVIAMTANTSDQTRDLCISSGMDDFLGKPFKGDDLIAKLAAWLPGKSPGN